MRSMALRLSLTCQISMVSGKAVKILRSRETSTGCRTGFHRAGKDLLVRHGITIVTVEL